MSLQQVSKVTCNFFLFEGMLRGFNSEDDDDVFVDPDAQNKVPFF